MELNSATEWATTSLGQARPVRAKDGSWMKCALGNSSGCGDGLEPF